MFWVEQRYAEPHNKPRSTVIYREIHHAMHPKQLEKKKKIMDLEKFFEKIASSGRNGAPVARYGYHPSISDITTFFDQDNEMESRMTSKSLTFLRV